jgi:hypothetical protein
VIFFALKDVGKTPAFQKTMTRTHSSKITDNNRIFIPNLSDDGRDFGAG